jgi:hypothetical protein
MTRKRVSVDASRLEQLEELAVAAEECLIRNGMLKPSAASRLIEEKDILQAESGAPADQRAALRAYAQFAQPSRGPKITKPSMHSTTRCVR